MSGLGVLGSGSDTDGAVNNSEAFAALGSLLAIARGNTGQSRLAANFLLAWWNAEACGGWDLTELWCVERVVSQDMLTVARFIGRHPHQYADAYGLGREFEGLVEQWRPHLLATAP